jgi:hypothetical protein
VVKSAIANAENNHNLDKDNLYIAEIYANQGPTLKRFRPRAQGRASQILKAHKPYWCQYYAKNRVRRDRMGQKVNPHGLRVGIIKDWDTKWYANKKDFGNILIEDCNIRKFVKDKLFTSGISKIEIERAANNRVKLNIHTAKPGMVIGKGGQGVEDLT